MTFSDSPDTYLADFGVSCTAGAVSGVGILDAPDSVIGGRGVSTEYALTCKYADFGGLKYADSITVDSVSYAVRENHRLDDGTFCRLIIEKT